ncbi:TAXI family TRAP transporter solute-binding subunit [Cupriavidus plantarum]|uniref:TAXI family TRAP transporter solute-binding subunit n=1 Tax=Cupriavidus plantarum TaxID=942865 RepID=UPI000EB563AF|nr:TAXI family TRAP transporter solute-binding subunit [Cupriavidus plantarum]NYI01935.1 TRAP transporter TAXI family solute receptor [Cupriavidus plantarum]RLK31596.1 TRAP transporter TAXI family solute receptor [Cupriavidus plantarum]CAG2147141.1 hypothetical protein LMG26296_04036 [Cupriavidus plantarum]SMR85633.1 TRAP transporter solute receptor, TAXI family [Cupriavidus plantarum]
MPATVLRCVAFVAVALSLAACGGGPDTGALRKGMDERLAQALPPGTLEVADFARRGSQADIKAPSGETRRIVYFDTDLRLKRDFDFGAWDAPGVAGLVSALGAGPKGISGITSGGNKAGDIIRAHGTALYRREGDSWVAVAAGGYRPAEAPAYATNATQGPTAILDAMRKVVDAAQQSASPAEQAVIQQELQAAYATIQARRARLDAGYAIAAGAEHGQYLRLAQAMAATSKVRAVPLVTHGGEENLRLLRDGRVSLALAQGDAALDAYEGKGAFAESGPYSALRAIGSLYPEAVHVLVSARGPVRAMADLRGKRIAIGARGSASRTTAVRVLQAHGLALPDIVPQDLDIGDALVALRANAVDAVVQIIGVPADSVRDMLADDGIRLLPLNKAGIDALAATQRGYFPYTIVKGAYSEQDEPVPTIATAAVLLAGADLSDTEVGNVTRDVYGKGNDLAARGSAQGVQIAPENARQGLPIPQHLAAAKVLDGMAGR